MHVRNCARIDLNPNARPRSAVDPDLRDALYLRQFSSKHRIRILIDVGSCDDIRGEGYGDNRKAVRVGLDVDWRARHALGQIRAGGVNCGLDLCRGRVDVLIEAELKNDA